jgi:hypothetical protein
MPNLWRKQWSRRLLSLMRSRHLSIPHRQGVSGVGSRGVPDAAIRPARPLACVGMAEVVRVDVR